MYSSIWTFLILCVVCSTLCRVISIKVNAKEMHRYGEDDTRMIQEIYQGLQRMQDRVESLETLLMDHAGPATARSGSEYREEWVK